jgi:high affinity sulfate transporter 1
MSSTSHDGGGAVTPRINWTAVAPGLAQFRGYRRSWLRGDVMAGLTVVAYLIPQAMAYATVAGLAPVAGLWAALLPLVIYAVMGSSRYLSAGPESSTALMTAAALAPLAAGDSGRYAALAAMLAVLVGLVCFTGGLLRLGFIADLLSRPVLIGYMAGVALIMIAGQLGKLTGTPVTGEGFVAELRSLAAALPNVHWPTLSLSVAVLAALVLLAWLVPRAPGPFIAVFLASAVVAGFSLHRYGIQVIGEVPAGLPAIGLSGVAVSDLGVLAAASGGVALVAFSDSVLNARIFAARKGETIDANAELRALGVCNMGSAVCHGFPVSSSASRTTLGEMVGARTQLYSLVVLGLLLVVMIFAHGLLAGFPTAALGALVVYAAVRLVDLAGFRRLAKFRRSELILAVLTAAAVLTLGVLYGVLAAVGLSILDLLRRVARPHDSVLGFVPGVAGMHDIEDYPHARLEPGLLIYRYDAPLFFANAEDFRKRATVAVDSNPDPVQWFVLNAEANVEVDLTALDAVDQLRQDLNRRGIVFGMARVTWHLREALDAAGLTDKIGEQNIFATLPTAVAAYRDRRTP